MSMINLRLAMANLGDIDQQMSTMLARHTAGAEPSDASSTGAATPTPLDANGTGSAPPPSTDPASAEMQQQPISSDQSAIMMFSAMRA